MPNSFLLLTSQVDTPVVPDPLVDYDPEVDYIEEDTEKFEYVLDSNVDMSCNKDDHDEPIIIGNVNMVTLVTDIENASVSGSSKCDRILDKCTYNWYLYIASLVDIVTIDHHPLHVIPAVTPLLDVIDDSFVSYFDRVNSVQVNSDLDEFRLKCRLLKSSSPFRNRDYSLASLFHFEWMSARTRELAKYYGLIFPFTSYNYSRSDVSVPFVSRYSNLIRRHSRKWFNEMETSRNSNVFRWSEYWLNLNSDATSNKFRSEYHFSWPNQLSSVPLFTDLRHYYSYHIVRAISHSNMPCDLHNTTCSYRDVLIPQVQYVTESRCAYKGLEVHDCRCRACCLLHTATLPNLYLLEPNEVVLVRCDEADSLRTPTIRSGVTDSSEQRAEFIVMPRDSTQEPRLAFRPRAFRTSPDNNRQITDHDLYVQFYDYTHMSTIYVLGTDCRYTCDPIYDCLCNVCKHLRDSLNMDRAVYNDTDEHSYVWIVAYDLRPYYILNSSPDYSYGPRSKCDMDLWLTQLRVGNIDTAHGFFPVVPPRYIDSILSSRNNNSVHSFTTPPICSLNTSTQLDLDNHSHVTVLEFTNAQTISHVTSTSATTVTTPLKVITDSGASRHMFYDRTLFTEYKPVGNHFVRIANGKVLAVLGIGSIGPLTNVLHVPDLILCLVAESQLDREGKSCITSNGTKTFYNSPDSSNQTSIFLVANLTPQGLYEVNPMYLGLPNPNYNYVCYDANASKAEAIDLLHKTIGHLSVDRLQQSVNTGHVRWNHQSDPVNFRRVSNPCVACDLAKSRRQSHTGHIRVPTSPGELSYIDVWGPCDTPSLLHDNVYTIGIIDATSKRA
jgi:hypothetical protein